MPFYEYQCAQCEHHLEAMQKINDAPLRKCPHCGKSALKRLMSAPVFRLKGAGWYETDFKSDQDNKRNLADAPEAEKAKPKEDQATESKAADKKDGDAAPAKDGAKDGAKDSAKDSGKDSSKDSSKESGKNSAGKGKESAPAAEKHSSGKRSAAAANRSGRAKPVTKGKPAGRATKKGAAAKKRR